MTNVGKNILKKEYEWMRRVLRTFCPLFHIRYTRKVIGPASLFIRWMVARAYARCSKLPTTYGAARGEKGKPL